jgi:predicted dehydrogenase
MAEPVAIGIIGCGNVSDLYLTGAGRSELVRVKAVADLRPEVAQAQAAKYGTQAMSIASLLGDREIQIVINLTVPTAHASVSRRVIEAGKHVYSEKPLATDVAAGRALIEAAAARRLRVGCAPDTFLGAGHQASRRAIDRGQIGRVVVGAATIMHHGMEHWHPNPAFFFKLGGGPVLDLGVYYITQLVHLLGAVERVTAIGSVPSPTRKITSDPLRGQMIDVEVMTTVNAVLKFAFGANVSLTTSWDVWKHSRNYCELYGTEGTLLAPDPNFFGGQPRVSERDGEWHELDISELAFGEPNRMLRSGVQAADYRIVGVIDMAMAIRANRPHRASGALALHVLEVMEGIELSSAEGRHIDIQSRCDRPEPLPLGSGEEVLVEG